MGCVLCTVGSIVSVVLDALERISLCTVWAMLICCLAITIIIILAIGIGIGYHYCFVSHMGPRGEFNQEKDPKQSNYLLHSVNKVLPQNSDHRIVRREPKNVISMSLIGKLTNTTVTLKPVFNFTTKVINSVW